MPTNHNPYCQHPTVLVNGSECWECRDCGRVLGPAPDAPGLTAAELAALAGSHAPVMLLDGPCCRACSWETDEAGHEEPYPCRILRLVAEVQRLRAAVSVDYA